jgi:hypothetical protein
MRRTLIIILLIKVSFICYTQGGSVHPDLGLRGVVTWTDSNHIKVEYDWSDDSQLLDWVTTYGSTLVREDGSVTITDGSISTVRAMIWKQGIKCSMINVKGAAPLSSAGHLNFYSNLISFTGNYLPDPGLGAVLANNKNFWTHNGTYAGSIGSPFLVEGVARDYEYSVTTAGMTIKSSIDEIVYSYNTPCFPELDRKIALGGWSGNTRWGKITIEGEVIIPWQSVPVPSDVINFQSKGAVFAPVIEVIGNPLIEWIFDDSTTSTSSTPVKDYGSEGSRHNYLKVTPWTSLIGINIGYDASDGGYGNFEFVGNQNVLGFQNLSLSKNSLKYLCASYNPITYLDLRDFSKVEFVELFNCKILDTLKLDTHPVLERLCVEDCNLVALDLSGCAALEDLRGAKNNYTSIKWSSIGQAIWHICIRDNPQLNITLPAFTQFPLLRELLIWNTNQTGAFECHSSVIRIIDAYKNHYSSADISGCTNLTRLYLSDNQLASLDIGTANNLNEVRLKNCGLNESQVDYILHTLDEAGRFNGILELVGNEVPSPEGLDHYNNLIGRDWTIQIEYLTNITDIEDKSRSLKTIVTSNELKISPIDSFISWNASLLNFQGGFVLSKTINSDTFAFDISSLSSGIYFLVLSKGDKTKVIKLIKP